MNYRLIVKECKDRLLHFSYSMYILKDIFKTIVIFILTWEARLVLRRRRPNIICVSGSVGKTSTKDAIATVLSARYSTRKSEKSYNSDFGVPLTILGLHSGWSSPIAWLENLILGAYEVVAPGTYPEWLVLEVGADKPGEIRNISHWLSCDIAVLTAFPDNPVHVEFFPSDSALFEEDLQVAYKLRSDQVVVVNGDDKNIVKYLPNIKAQILTFGFDKSNDWWASPETLDYNGEGKVVGLSTAIHQGENNFKLEAPGLLGYHQLYALLSAMAVGEFCGISPMAALESLREFQGPPGRLRIIPGIKDTTIIDDTYNASPAAVEAGLNTLAKIKTKGRRIAILGDMLELGDRTIDAHRVVGNHVGTLCDLLIAVGLRSKFIIEGSKERGMKDANIWHCSNSVEAGAILQDILKPGDLVYIKGSQSMRMERVVEEVMAEPDRKVELLCRQDRIWRSK